MSDQAFETIACVIVLLQIAFVAFAGGAIYGISEGEKQERKRRLRGRFGPDVKVKAPR